MSLFLVNTCSDTFALHEFLNSFWNVLKTKTIERYYCYSHSSYSVSSCFEIYTHQYKSVVLSCANCSFTSLITPHATFMTLSGNRILNEIALNIPNNMPQNLFFSFFCFISNCLANSFDQKISKFLNKFNYFDVSSNYLFQIIKYVHHCAKFK